MQSPNLRMPSVYLPHGGGPWPFVDLGHFVDRRECDALANYLTTIPARLPTRPRAIVVVSAHWEAPVPTVMTSARPPILYDYYGFPPDAYRVTWPAPGQPELAARVRALLDAAGMGAAEDPRRGYDHGTFVPLKLTFPEADVPTVQLSLEEGLDPARHIAIGRALAPLRTEGVLLVGSGMSFHNLREYKAASAQSVVFDDWLQRVVVEDQAERDADLVRWSAAPAARRAHPREEHLLPLMVMAGAAGSDRGRVMYSGTFGGARICAVHFGA
ncbi:MAG TPA: class III extradiol ring-cleavage dioxygenase [Polyangiaceae bacterium]|nr:class III extradiol ring-cleavage dioxygenase [Polyangiaceae bacterium]